MKPLKIATLSVENALFFWCNASNDYPIVCVAVSWEDEKNTTTYIDHRKAVEAVEHYAAEHAYTDIEFP